jgi:SAM-dependent methyltransferase
MMHSRAISSDINRRMIVFAAAVVVSSVLCISTTSYAQDKPFEPQVGQPGKDVVWVPTPPELVNKMMELAKVTPQDYVMDLGSGDGRNIIAAAKIGATAVGVEYNPDMVALSKRNAAAAGVGEKAQFVEGDMFVADISKASVMALFLLPSNMLQLRDKFYNLRPGSRIVSNTFGIEGWTPDEQATVGGDCNAWCNALLWIVPAKVDGAWRLADGTLTLKQDFQMVSGTLGTTPIVNGRLRGEMLTFQAAGAEYSGRVVGNRIEGTMKSGATQNAWTATKN